MSRTKRGVTENEFYKSLGARIRIAREVRGLTQGQLGKKLGLTRTSIVNIEQGRQGIPLHQFVKLTERLGVSFRLLITGRSQAGAQGPMRKP